MMHEPVTIGRRAVVMTGLAGFAAAAVAPRTAVIPIDVADGRCVAPVTLNGQRAAMILDTGAARSLITRTAAFRLALPFDRWVDSTVRDAGGRLETHANADIAAAAIAGVPLYQRPATRSLSLAVAGIGLAGADGLLGGDVLRHFTLCLDVPAARLTIFEAEGDPPMTGGIPLRPLWPDLLLAPVALDGFSMTALVDTGSTVSMINSRGLHRLGLTPARLERDIIVSVAGVAGRLSARLHRFAELRIAAVTVATPEILVASVPETGFDMILGMDIMSRQRICLSYTQRKMGFYEH
jgi:predicted aspartyl protease